MSMGDKVLQVKSFVTETEILAEELSQVKLKVKLDLKKKTNLNTMCKKCSGRHGKIVRDDAIMFLSLRPSIAMLLYYA